MMKNLFIFIYETMGIQKNLPSTQPFNLFFRVNIKEPVFLYFHFR